MSAQCQSKHGHELSRFFSFISGVFIVYITLLMALDKRQNKNNQHNSFENYIFLSTAEL